MKIRGKLGSKFILAITVDLIKSWPRTLQNQLYLSKSSNEKFISNQYIYYIPISISKTCEKGHFFDHQT